MEIKKTPKADLENKKSTWLLTKVKWRHGLQASASR